MANTVHHAADDIEIKNKTLRHVVVRQLLWPVFMEFFRQNVLGPQPYPIEGIGIFTLMVRAWWVVVLAAAPHGQCFAEVANPNSARSGIMAFFWY